MWRMSSFGRSLSDTSFILTFWKTVRVYHLIGCFIYSVCKVTREVEKLVRDDSRLSIQYGCAKCTSSVDMPTL